LDQAIQEFWKTVLGLQHDLMEQGNTLGDLYDKLLQKVQAVDPGIYLEMSVGTTPRQLIVTAAGNKDLFPVAERIVQAAPPIPGWTVIALKPRIGFPEKATWEGIQVRIADVRCKPVERPDGVLDLKLYVPDLHPENKNAVHNALLGALDHGLGERTFAEQIEGTSVAPKPGMLESMGLMKLSALEDYLRRRK
jgi:hypothetical protein